MTRIAEAFSNKKAFIPFLTCGDPDLETTAEFIKVMEQAGADIIELGIPFSDPTAEGPVIQGANLRALKTGVTTDKIFDMVEDVQKEVSVPLGIHDLCECGLFLWYKTIFRAGKKSRDRRIDPAGCAV